MLQGEAKRAYQREYMRKRRAGEVTRKRPKTIADIDKKIAQWQTKFRRALNALTKLAAQRKRMVKAAVLAAGTPHAPVTMIAVAGPEPRAPRRTKFKVTPRPDPAGFFGDKLREYMLTKAKALRAAEKAEPGIKRPATTA